MFFRITHPPMRSETRVFIYFMDICARKRVILNYSLSELLI